MLRAATNSYSYPSSISMRWRRCSRVIISSSLNRDFLYNLITEAVTIVWKRLMSSLCFVTRVLMVQKTRSLENMLRS